MADLLDANWFRMCAFCVAVAVAVGAWLFETNEVRPRSEPGRRILWPTFWLALGAVYATMAIAIGADLAGRLSGAGREYARNGDWYESRRSLQTAVVIGLALVWLAIIVIGILRVPERRRRYLPSALLGTTLVCFALIRMVSLHHVDTVVHRTSIVGVPLGTVFELAGIVVSIVLTAIGASRPVPRADRPSAVGVERVATSTST